MRLTAMLPLALAALIAMPAPLHAEGEGHNYPEARSYEISLDATVAVGDALTRAERRGTKLLLVMGANWCHDSRALAGWLETPRFQALIADHYELVFVDAGTPQQGEVRNLHIAQRFGIDELPGTPNLFVVAADGTLLNADSVTTWRNAASRSEDEIFAELEGFALQK